MCSLIYPIYCVQSDMTLLVAQSLCPGVQESGLIQGIFEVEKIFDFGALVLNTILTTSPSGH